MRGGIIKLVKQWAKHKRDYTVLNDNRSYTFTAAACDNLTIFKYFSWIEYNGSGKVMVMLTVAITFKTVAIMVADDDDDERTHFYTGRI